MQVRLETQPTSYPISDFVGWQRQGLLDLRPPYQRLSVWSKRAKSLLIDSVLRGYPIPLIFVQNTLDLERAITVRQVVDGQQRIRTLAAFVDPSSLEDWTEDDDFTVLRAHNKDYCHLTFGELPEEVRARILETRLPVVVLPSGIPDVEILRIFQRMNSTGLKLNPQELRNAEYYGEFKDLSYALAYSQHQRWLSWHLFDPPKIARMLEVEFTSDVLGLILDGVKARTKGSIDRLYRDYDSRVPNSDQVSTKFESSMDQLDSIFGLDRSPSSLRRFRTPGWIYSSFAVVSNSDLVDPDGVSRTDVNDLPAPPSPGDLTEALQRCDSLLRGSDLDETIAKVLRGATADRSSRQRRIAFIRQHLTE